MSNRRGFITLLGGALAIWPLGGHAQQRQQAVPVVGILGTTTPSAWASWTSAFVLRLSELGWIEGRNISIEYRWAEGRSERYAEIAAEFARLQVNVIVTSGPAILALKQATSVIPIVFATANDRSAPAWLRAWRDPAATSPVHQFKTRRLPGSMLKSCASLFRSSTVGDHGQCWLSRRRPRDGEIRSAATKLGLEVVILEIRRGEDIGTAFRSINGRAEALAVCQMRSCPLIGLASTRR
jgi:putative ABC transport system substrate-binding protein